MSATSWPAPASIVIVVPARNEAPNIEHTVSVLLEGVGNGLADRLIVVDGGSEDDTAALAAAAGAEVLHAHQVLTSFGPVLGKGDSMWRALSHVTEDVVVYLDADLGNLSLDQVGALIEPIRAENGVALVKGSFGRITPEGERTNFDGGRVTELLARPLLSVRYPDLAGLRQPLSGQVAVRRSVANNLSFLTGFGVEIGMLLDIRTAHGRHSIVEADMGVVVNKLRDAGHLSPMALEVAEGFLLRTYGDTPGNSIRTMGPDLEWSTYPSKVVERPSVNSLR